jgi:hypothetical protein
VPSLPEMIKGRTPAEVVAEHRELMDDLALQGSLDALLAAHRRPMSVNLTLKASQEILDAEKRRDILARLERAQAEHGARLVRAAGEAVPNAAAPGITPDTVWSGDFDVLVELFKISQYRVNAEAAYISQRHHPCVLGVSRHTVRRVHKRGTLDRAVLEG